MKRAFPVVITILIFSIWAIFALLIVNPYLSNNLPGYTVGRLCIWELVAFIIAGVLAKIMLKKWGNIETTKIGNKTKIVLNTNYGKFFLIYFIFAIIISVWQFWLFSQNF